MDGDADFTVAQNEQQPLLADSKKPCKEVNCKTVTKLIKRLKLMVLKLLPIQVDEDSLTSPTSSIITKEVVQSFMKAGGDFAEAVPYCLLEARRAFAKDALRNPSDYDEHMGRSVAAEMLARRVIMKFPVEQQPAVMSTRYVRIESDGDHSLPTSALESAVDQHCPIFLSSDTAQSVVWALWDGNLVQSFDERGHVEYDLYSKIHKRAFLDRLDPSRLAVPRYQNWLKILLWVIFLVCYSIAIQTPDREFGLEDVILYVQLLGYILEDITRVWKIGPRAAFNFWAFVNYSIYGLLMAAFAFRVADLSAGTDEKAVSWRRLSFNLLSLAAPLIWMKLLTIFDVFTYFGTLQIVVFRMMRESAIFFTLLALLAVGFAQALLGLDASDEDPGNATQDVVRSLVEGLLGSPNFDMYAKGGTVAYPFGTIAYILWCFLTLVILLNVLVALFGSAYQQVTDEAVSQYMAFFAGKVVAAVRAPDQFVYVAPFNLLELPLLPFEHCLSKSLYAKINRIILTSLFFPVLCVIALFETRFDSRRAKKLRGSFDEEDDQNYEEDPEEETGDEGKICQHKFEDLTKDFPNLESSATTTIIIELMKLKKQLSDVEKELCELKTKKED